MALSEPTRAEAIAHLVNDVPDETWTYIWWLCWVSNADGFQALVGAITDLRRAVREDQIHLERTVDDTA